jgi:hypothetical protein
MGPSSSSSVAFCCLPLDEFDELCESDVLDVFDMATSNTE